MTCGAAHPKRPDLTCKLTHARHPAWEVAGTPPTAQVHIADDPTRKPYLTGTSTTVWKDEPWPNIQGVTMASSP